MNGGGAGALGLEPTEVSWLERVGLTSARATLDGAADVVLPEKLALENSRLVSRGRSHQNTAELALGLVVSGVTLEGADPGAMADVLWRDLQASGDYRSLAFLLQLESARRSARAELVWKALSAAIPASATQSMDLAWALEAAAAYAIVTRGRRDVGEVAGTLSSRLMANQSRRSGLFHGSARREGWLRRRVRLTTLSSQVFPIRALARYAEASGRTEALGAARAAFDALCQHQGPSGEWWRKYDAFTGAMVERYPLHGVSQACALPTAALAMERAGCPGYAQAACRGFRWLSNAGGPAVRLRDYQYGVVWSGIQETPGGLEPIREMYGYFPGRCLSCVAAIRREG